MKEFSDFRNHWLTPDKELELKNKALTKLRNYPLKMKDHLWRRSQLHILFCCSLSIMSG